METTDVPFGATVRPLVNEDMYNPNALVTLRYIDPETSANSYKLYKVVDLEEPVHVRIPTLEAQVSTLRNTIDKSRSNVRDLYTTINDDIESNGWNEDDTITLKELSDYLENVFGNRLSFMKEYEAFVSFKVSTHVMFKAESADLANEIAESIQLEIDDSDITYDGDAEVNEVYVDETSVDSVEEQQKGWV